MLRRTSFERAEFLLKRQVSEGWIDEYGEHQVQTLSGMIQAHAKSRCCIANLFENLEVGQIDQVKRSIQRCDLPPAGGLFIPDVQPEGTL